MIWSKVSFTSAGLNNWRHANTDAAIESILNSISEIPSPVINACLFFQIKIRNEIL